jgi:hypothetical protein
MPWKTLALLPEPVDPGVADSFIEQWVAMALAGHWMAMKTLVDACDGPVA